MQILLDLLVKIGNALWDRWQSIQQAIFRGRAEGEADAIRQAEEAESRGEEAAKQADKLPPTFDDGWRRD